MNNVKVVGKGGISATIIAHSKSDVDGSEIITYELEYHRYIHGEFMTHRLFSRNAASSRAIPVAKMIELVKNSPAVPIHWGKNQTGMQAKEECNSTVYAKFFRSVKENTDDEKVLSLLTNLGCTREVAWGKAIENATSVAENFADAGYHKQIVNRLLEPFQMIKVVVTATEWDNFFWLRFHDKAQPEIHELARCMLAAKKRSVPEVLNVGEWHTPYVQHERVMCQDENGYMDGSTELLYKSGDKYLSLEEALHVSASCSAQVSYRKTDNSLEKGEKVWQMLTTDDRLHGSPMEHQATPIHWMFAATDWGLAFGNEYDQDLPDGITHMDREGNFWSNNFKGWVQHRALIPNNNCTSFDYTQEIDETGLEITEGN